MSPFSSWWRGSPDQLRIDDDGWLSGWGVKIVRSHKSWTSGQRPTVAHRPEALLWHYTATEYGTAKNMAKRRAVKRIGTDRPASWHVTVAGDGTLWQQVSFEHVAWHCGAGRIGEYRVNECSVGIELEGHGLAFPEAQLDAAERLVVALVGAYELGRRACSYGHSEFDPARRSDPGRLWTGTHLPVLLSTVFA